MCCNCLQTTAMDPCLDDCVMFAKRLKNLNKSISLDVLTGLPHGFLNFSLVSTCILFSVEWDKFELSSCLCNN